MKKFAQHVKRAGISQDDLTSLNVIHVSGTKGKGSVCAFSESILRHAGYKTGFFSSPHLIDVIERIRINGVPVSQETFASFFMETYDLLNSQKTHESDLPPYFFFLNILAFKIFLKEKVDVAIFEVGLGGTHDSTNVINKPVVCAVTALDFDHQKILGYSIEEIAWNKAGIFKSGAPAFTINQKVSGALEKLQECAKEKNVHLEVVENNRLFDDILLGLDGAHQLENASLAVQICKTWTQRMGFSALKQESLRKGLETVRWPGRCEKISLGRNLTFYLDGAHTAESLKLCRNWFEAKITTLHKPDCKKVLICTFTSERNDENFLNILNEGFGFDHVLFTPPTLKTENTDGDRGSVTYNAKSLPSSDFERCQKNLKIWNEMNGKSEVFVFSFINDAIDSLRDKPDAGEVCVLVTGSLYLVGGCLKLLYELTEPSL